MNEQWMKRRKRRPRHNENTDDDNEKTSYVTIDAMMPSTAKYLLLLVMVYRSRTNISDPITIGLDTRC